jgi:predicted dehydrogenase
MNKRETNITEFNRRDFLRGGSLATLMAMMGGVPLLAQPEPAKPADKTDAEPKPKVKVALIGLGPWGRNILDQLCRLDVDSSSESKGIHVQPEIAAICDTYAPMVRRSSHKVPKAAKVADYKAILDNKDIQAVIIATPTHQHKDIAVAALQAGKHVYCEAPLANTIEDAKAIALAANKAASKFFQSGIQMRCDPQLHWLIPFIRSGALGKFVMAKAQWHKKESWRSSSANPDREKAINWRLDKAISLGLPGEVGIHQIDMAAWFLNGLPTAVTGYGTIAFWKDDGRDVDDTVELIVDYPNAVRLAYDCTLANSFDGEYNNYYGSDAAVMLRPGFEQQDSSGNTFYHSTGAWMFKEVDAALLGWEVYARKDTFYRDTGIALVAGGSKQSSLAGGGAAASAFPEPPLYYALDAFLNNCVDTDKNVQDFKANYNSTDPKVLAQFLAAARQTTTAGNEISQSATARQSVIGQAPTQEMGYAATVVAIKASEAVRNGERIEIKKEWLELT